VPRLALRIANRVQQPGLHRQPQLAPCGILADLDLCGVVGGFQLGASNACVSGPARRRLSPRLVMMLSITAWIRREAPAGPGAPSVVRTVGSMPVNPLEAAASCPSAVVARAIAVAASSACPAWTSDCGL